jgi:hypothetical protein
MDDRSLNVGVDLDVDEFTREPAYDDLGARLGILGDLARMRMVRLWRWQEVHGEMPANIVPRATVIDALESDDAPAALVAVGLAEEVGDRLRVRWPGVVGEPGAAS